ncbi:MAG TPA: glycosyltransferase family 2 protein [Steroidobacteraceae bacterium]|nr:glycosyltransferase family 2 protein [Steroidobacteraceae bacterium]
MSRYPDSDKPGSLGFIEQSDKPETMLKLCILCPIHNEEKVVPLFFARMLPVMEALAERYSVDLVFLNNASTDATKDAVLRLRERWASVYVITMSRNVGYQRSLDCGLRNSRGDLFAIIDVDCEDPPEMLLDFATLYEQGFDIAYGIRADRQEVAALKSTRKLFYRILKMVADEDIILDMAEFSLFTSEVRDSMLVENNSFPFVRASISRVGFRRIGIPFRRQSRIAGRTHYNFLGMSTFAIAGILSASTLMLRLPIFILPFWLLSLVLIGLRYAATGSRGYAVAGIILLAAYLGASISFVALYVARTYKNGLRRPNSHIHLSNSALQSDDPTWLSERRTTDLSSIPRGQ